jgi:hypothetical protein
MKRGSRTRIAVHDLFTCVYLERELSVYVMTRNVVTLPPDAVSSDFHTPSIQIGMQWQYNHSFKFLTLVFLSLSPYLSQSNSGSLPVLCI